MPQARPKNVTGIQQGESLTNRVAGPAASPGDGEVIDFDKIGQEPKLEETKAAPAKETKEPETKSIPDKFKGKSLEEVVDMYTNLETAYGRQGNTMGELRQLADQLIMSQKKDPEPEDPKPLTVEDLLADPDKSLNDVIANHPKVKEAAKVKESMDAATAQKALAAAHADYEQIMQDPRFEAYLKEHPDMAQIAYMGNMTYQPSLVAHVLDVYKAQTAHAQGNNTSTEEAFRKASVETRPNPSEGGERKQYYRRSDLLRLRSENPDKYDSMYTEIARAYKEGRVLD